MLRDKRVPAKLMKRLRDLGERLQQSKQLREKKIVSSLRSKKKKLKD